MPLPENSYIPWQGLQTAFLDKITGDPLSAGYINFYSDVARSVPKDVFIQEQQPDNTYNFVNVGPTVTLTSVGTTANPNDGTDAQIYAYPFDADGNIELYYLEVYSSGNVLQITREAQPPNVVDSENIAVFQGNDNQIENPQFVVTNEATKVYDVAGAAKETLIAPDWSIITNGTGTVTVTQEALTDISMPTGAPFAINISSTGVTAVTLRQRLLQSPRLMGQGYIFGSFVAKSAPGSSVPLIMNYTASNLYSVELVNQSTTADGNYNTMSDGESKFIDTTNNNSPDAPGYVDIDIVIPALASVGITSVQVTNTEGPDDTTQFLQISTPRQIDQLYHYYNLPLQYKPIPSYLVGWDFPLNPAQFADDATGAVASQALGVNTAYYAWDQTILFQTATSGITVSRSSVGALVLTANANTQMAVVQYIPFYEVNSMLNNALSVNVSAYTSKTGGLDCTVSLWYTDDASLPDLKSPNYFIFATGIDADGYPSGVRGNWKEVPRIKNQNNATFTIEKDVTQNFFDYGFNGWDLEGDADIAAAAFFAIMVGTSAMVSASTDSVTFNSISVVPGDVPTIPAPQTYDDVLRECQRYYETNLSPGQAKNTFPGAVCAPMNPSWSSGTNTLFCVPNSFGYRYQTPKYFNPTLTFYSGSSATADRVTAYCYGVSGNAQAEVTASSYFTQFSSANNEYGFAYQGIGTSMTSVGSNALSPASANILYHFTADGRPGIS